MKEVQEWTKDSLWTTERGSGRGQRIPIGLAGYFMKKKKTIFDFASAAAHVGSQGVFLEEEVTTIKFSFRIWQHLVTRVS